MSRLILIVFVIFLVNAFGCQYFDIVIINVHGSLVEARGIGNEINGGSCQ